MPIDFNKARDAAISKLDIIGQSSSKFELFVATNILEQYAFNFATLIEKNIKDKKLVATGDLGKNIRVDVSPDGRRATIYMLDYYDYVNEGVKGWGDDSNAPNSPYQYKTKGMNKKGRDTIKKYILESRSKIRSTETDKARGIGQESKGIKVKKKKSLIDTQVNTLVYLIKKYGIKRTDYFNDAYETAFAGWETELAKAMGEDIKLNIKLIGKQELLNKK